MIGNKDRLIDYLKQQNSTVLFDLSVHKEKRSLNANSYFWSLINKIANAMRISKEECYKNMLVHYGQSQTISVLSGVDINGYFKYFDVLGHSTINNKDFTHYRVYKGSSEYNTYEMAILLDGAILEAENLGIEIRNDTTELLRRW